MSKTAVKKKEGEETLGAKAAEIGRKSLEFFIGPIPRPTVFTPREQQELDRARDEARAEKRKARHGPEKPKKHAKAAKKMEIYTAVAVAEPAPKAARKVRTAEEAAPEVKPEAQAKQTQWIEAPAEPERQHRSRRRIVISEPAAAPEVKVEEAPKPKAAPEPIAVIEQAPEPIAVVEPAPEQISVYEKPAEKSDAEKKAEDKKKMDARLYEDKLKGAARKAGAPMREEIGAIAKKAGMDKGAADAMESFARVYNVSHYPYSCQLAFMRVMAMGFLKVLPPEQGGGPDPIFKWKSDGNPVIENVDVKACNIPALRMLGAKLCEYSSDGVGYSVRAEPGENRFVLTRMTLSDLERVREAVRFIMKQYEKHLKPLEGGHLEHHVDWETGDILVGNVDFHASSIAPLKLACRLVGAQRRGVTYEMSEDERNGIVKLELVRYAGQFKPEKPIDLGK